MSESKFLDVSNLSCPMPLVTLQKTLKETQKGDTLIVLTGSPTAKRNIQSFLEGSKLSFNTEDNQFFIQC